MTAGTTYYVRAYAINSKGVAYAAVASFETLKMSSSVAVDLGLSVKWASCNVGASLPEEYGDYFAWGEVKPKSSYTESNSVTYGLSTSTLKSRGIIDSDGNLTAAYDAATVNWGGGWRMPTLAEVEELIDECTWEWTTYKNVNGYRVTGPNANSIFLPAAGFYDGIVFYDTYYYDHYWSATCNSDSNFAYDFFFESDGYVSYNSRRYYGYPTRPVLK